MHGFIGKKNTYREKKKRCHPHSAEWGHYIFFCIFFSAGIEKEKEYEQEYSNDNGSAQTSFSYDRAKWRPNQK